MIKKLQTQQEIERKRKRNQLILGIGLVLLMILSTAGFSLMNTEDTQTQNTLNDKGYQFYLQGGYWILPVQGQQFIFQNLPSDVENIPTEGTYNLNNYAGQTIYFLEETQATTQIINNLQPYILRYQEACLEGEPCEKDVPIKTCENHIFITIPGDNNRVYKEQNCIYLMGDAIKTIDAFMYKALGIN